MHSRKRKPKVSAGWKTLSSSEAHRNPWYSIAHDRVKRPDGRAGDYYVLHTRGPSVFVVAENGREEICLVRLHRYPTRMLSWEIPGGNSDGQPLLKAAKRELKEETGLSACRWKKAGSWQPMNGITSEISHVFLAAGLEGLRRKGDRAEGISRAEFVRWDRAFEMIRKGSITDGQTIAGLFLAAVCLKRVKKL